MVTYILTLYEYAILMSLVLQNGTLLIEGHKDKLRRILAIIDRLKNKKLINFSKVLITSNDDGELTFHKIRLLDFAPSDFRTVDLGRVEAYVEPL